MKPYNFFSMLKRASVGRRFVFFILLFSSIVTLILTGLQLKVEYDTDIRIIHLELDQVRDSYTKSIAENLWVISDERVKLQIKGISTLPDVEYVKVTTEEKKVFERGRKVSEHFIERTYPLTYSYRGNEVSLGDLYVVATLEKIYDRLQDKVLFILLSQGLKTFVVSLFILYLSHMLIGRHLHTIGEFFKKTKNKVIDEKLTLNREDSKQTKGDELDQIVESINVMNHNLKVYYDGLEKSEKFLNEAQRISHVGGWKFDPSTEKIQWSEEVYRIYEMKPFSEAIDLAWFMSHLYKEDIPMIEEAVKKAIDDEKTYDVQHRIITAKSNDRFVHQTAEVYIEDGVKKMSGIIQDITTLKQAQDESKTIIREAPNPIMVHNEDGKVLVLNKVWERLTGYKHSEIDTIEKWTLAAYGQGMSVVKEHIDKLYALEHAVDEGSYEIIRKDGETIIWQFSSVPLGVINGKRTVISSAMDITELKQKDELLIAQSRHAAMGEMISMIAHQWRQPLTTISMNMNNMLLDIELGQFDVDEAKKYANSIIRNTQNLSKTIDDFRTFFIPEKSPSKVKIPDILENTCTMIEESLTNNDIKLVTSYHVKSEVEAYPREIMQVFMNIINNAKDALLSTDTSDATIDIKVYEDTQYVITDIIDNGPGIDDEIVTKIFDPYFSTKDEKNGTGLGLYMSKMIIEDHLDGKIEALKVEGKTCFRIMLKK